MISYFSCHAHVNHLRIRTSPGLASDLRVPKRTRGPLTPALLGAALPSGPVRVPEAEWVAVPPGSPG